MDDRMKRLIQQAADELIAMPPNEFRQRLKEVGESAITLALHSVEVNHHFPPQPES